MFYKKRIEKLEERIEKLEEDVKELRTMVYNLGIQTCDYSMKADLLVEEKLTELSRLQDAVSEAPTPTAPKPKKRRRNSKPKNNGKESNEPTE